MPPVLQHAMTVDLEESFNVENLRDRLPRSRWEAQPLAAERQTERLLDLFESEGIKATFFVLGFVAERLPNLVRAIHRRGHEIAAHSSAHRLVFEQGPVAFRADLREVKARLEALIGEPVIGYRAPTFSITEASLWAHRILREEGFLYSSSVFPVHHDRYGIPGYFRVPTTYAFPEGCLTEFPLSTLPCWGAKLPISGGGYLRLLPGPLMRAAILRFCQTSEHPFVLYLHPWELDPEIPRHKQGLLRDLRGYAGLASMSDKVRKLCQIMPWGPIRAVLAHA